MGLFSKNVSNDAAVATTMSIIEALYNTKDSSCPMLRFEFKPRSISFLFVDVHACAVTIYQGMLERGQIDEGSANKLIGEAFNADMLPKGSGISFKHDSDGNVDSYTIIGEFPTEHSKAQSDYIKEIENRCNQKGYRCKRNKNTLSFLNWA